jgi:hypothetical protein
MEPPEPGDDAVDQVAQLLVVPDVGPGERRLGGAAVPEFLLQDLAGVLVPPGDDGRGSPSGVRDGGRPADAGQRTGDENDRCGGHGVRPPHN